MVDFEILDENVVKFVCNFLNKKANMQLKVSKVAFIVSFLITMSRNQHYVDKKKTMTLPLNLIHEYLGRVYAFMW